MYRDKFRRLHVAQYQFMKSLHNLNTNPSEREKMAHKIIKKHTQITVALRSSN